MLRGPFGFRTIVLAIVVMAFLPPCALAGLALWRFADSERSRAVEFLQAQAQGIASDIDRSFGNSATMLLALASAPTLQNLAEPAAAEAMLRTFAARSGRPLILIDGQGRVLVDTRGTGGGAPGVVRPPGPGDEPFRGAVVSNVRAGVADGGFGAVVAVPVARAGGALSLATVVSSADASRIIASSGVPPDWIVSIVDRRGVHLARSHGADAYVGKPVVPALVDRIKRGIPGLIETDSLEGIPLISTIVRAPDSRWSVAIGLPRAELEAPLSARLLQLLVAGLAVLAGTIVLVLLLVRRFEGSFSRLTQAAADLGAGNPVSLPVQFVREANTIGQAMGRASRQLAERAASVSEARAGLESQVTARTAELVAEMQRREDTEQQVRQMQKIEAVGQLTGGIAHDFNNMLAIVLSCLDLVERRLARGQSDVGTYIDGARQGAERAAALTRRLLAFARQQPLEPRVVDCNRLVADVSDLLRRTIPENVTIETVLAGGLWRSHVDTNQLESALVNLAANARDAMPDGGKLTIETANAHLDDRYAAQHPEVRAGQYVLIAMTDTGMGMSPEAMRKAFEPFFTTKPLGQGTGLGLSQVHGFLKQSGGHAMIYSEPGQGVTVKLYLPRFFGAAEDAAGEGRAPSIPRARDGTLVLVVEDEAEVRRLTLDMLAELDYRTLAADSGEQALQLLAANPAVRVLLTDVVMPGMNGRQLADRALQMRPALKVLFTTGYTRNAIVHNGMLDPGVNLIMKPFTLEALAQKLALVVEPSAAGDNPAD